MNNYMPNNKRSIVIVGTVVTLVVSFTSVIMQVSLAQGNVTGMSSPNIIHAKGPVVEHLVTKTDGGSLYLALDIQGTGGDTITFLDPATNRTVASVDYDIVVKTANTSNIVYKASQQAGQTDKPLQAGNGFVSIPDESFSSGVYDITVYVYAINGVSLKTVDSGGGILCLGSTCKNP